MVEAAHLLGRDSTEFPEGTVRAWHDFRYDNARVTSVRIRMVYVRPKSARIFGRSEDERRVEM